MKLSFSSSWFLLVVATPSVVVVVAKKGKKTKNTKNKNSGKSVVPSFVPIDNDNDNDSNNIIVPIFVPVNNDNDSNNNLIPNLGVNLNCDPMSSVDDEEWGCRTEDCASDVWKDGCLACMCFNNGNASWCDGRKSAYYDDYFEGNGENPFGDTKRENRKCNIIFLQEDAKCYWDWQCESESESGTYCAFVMDCQACEARSKCRPMYN